MICPKCGSPIGDGEKFCSSCGYTVGSAAPQQPQPQPQYTAPQQPQYTAPQPQYTAPQQARPQQGFQQGVQNAVATAKPKAQELLAKVKPIVTNKIFIIAAAAVVVLIIAIIVIANIAGSAVGAGKYDIYSTGYYYESIDGELHVFFDGTEVKDNSFDDYDDYGFGTEGGYVIADGTLYAVTGSSSKKISDDVNSVYTGTFSGKAFVYLSDDTYYLYNGSSKEMGDYDDISNIVISPNGSCAAFVMDREVNLLKGSKPEMICEEGYPKCVADDGTTFIINNGEFLVSNGGKKVDFDSDEQKPLDISEFMDVTSDHKTYMYYDNGTTRVYNPSMNKPAKVESSYINIQYPANSDFLSSFDSFVASKGDSYYRYILRGDKYEDIKIVSGVSGAYLSQDGSKLAYVKDEKAYVVSTTAKDAEKVLVAKKVNGLVPTPDLSLYYYTTVDDGKYDLYVSTGNAESTKKVLSDVNEYSNFTMLTNGNFILLDDDVVIVSVKGDKPIDSNLDDVSGSISTDKTGSNVYCWSDDVLYVSKDGKTFTSTKVEK